MPDVIAERLRQAREAAGFSQGQVEAYASINRQQLSDWERGEIPSTWHKLLKLCQYYGVSLDWVFGLRDETSIVLSSGGEEAILRDGKVIIQVSSMVDSRLAQQMLDKLAVLPAGSQRLLSNLMDVMEREDEVRIIGDE